MPLIAVIVLAACGGPEETSQPTQTPIPATTLPPSATPATTDLPSPTPLPADGQTDTQTRTQSPTVYVDDSMNLRSGPGTEFDVVGSAEAGDSFAIIGVDITGDWWQINADSGIAWIYGPYVRTENTESVLLVEEPSVIEVLPPTATPLPPLRTVSAEPQTNTLPHPHP
ncbi:MAG: SH3 domain-containing protein [Caldilineaceae bacterium]